MELTMHAYAQIDADHIVVGVSLLAGPVVDARMIPINPYDESLLGKVYDVSTGTFADAPSLPPPTIEERRTQVSEAIDLHAKALRDNVVQLISPAEMSSWPIKQAQALAYQETGDDASAPMLVAEAGYRQVTTSDLVDMVLAKATQLAALEAMISGECGRRQDLLRAADLAQIDVLAAGVRFGWLDFPDPAQ